MIDGLKSLIGIYDSNELDVVKAFYNPLFQKAIHVDRISCYFSSKALSQYARGLEEFSHKADSKYRLIVSTEISSEDYQAMIDGEDKQAEIDEDLCKRLRETLTLQEEFYLSNLSFLISVGVVEIKIAYVKKGIFHYKMMYAEDDFGRSIFVMGSNNETEAAICRNYEIFSVVDGNGQKYRFENYWYGKVDEVLVRKPSQCIWEELQLHNRGRLIEYDDDFAASDCLYLDLDKGEIILDVRLESPPSNYSIVQHAKINRFVKSYSEKIIFKEEPNYMDCKAVVNALSGYCSKNNFRLIVSSRLSEFIDNHDLIIEQRRSLGIDIKHHEHKLDALFNHFKGVVDGCMVRKMRDRQMWDSFFMYSMKKAGNFSVPGSGKTSAVLGVFAFSK